MASLRIGLPVAASAIALAISAPGPARAAKVTLDFEGIPNFAYVDEFYYGGPFPITGTDSSGGVGPAYGVRFGSHALVLTKIIPGFLDNVPSGEAVVALSSAIHRDEGFESVSFYYNSEYDVDAYVSGNFQNLAKVTLPAQHDPTCGALLCNWTFVQIPFVGLGTSLYFLGNTNSLVIDDLTFGLPGDPGAGSGVPEPAAWALLIAGFGLTGAMLRRGRRSAVGAYLA